MSLPESTTHLPAQPAMTRHRQRSGWARSLLYLVIFLSGIAVGGGATLIVVRNSILHAVHQPGDMPRLITRRMSRALDLSSQQAEQVEAVLRERQSALQQIRREYQPRVETKLDHLKEQISEILDAQQQVKWRSRFEELQRTWIPAPPTEGEGGID